MTKRSARWRKKTQIEMLEYIYELIDGGYSMKQALGFLETIIPSSILYHQILELFEEGKHFSEVIELLRYPHIIQTIIRFGEASGMLKESIQRSIHYLKLTLRLREKIAKQLQYPLVVFGATLIFVIGFHLFLLPQIFSIQKMIAVPNESFSTKLVMCVLTGLPYSIGMVIGMFLFIGSIFMYLYQRGDSRWFYYMLRVPFLKKVVQLWNQIQITMLTRVFFEQGYGVKRLFEEMQKGEYPSHIQSQAKHIYRYLNDGYSYFETLENVRIYTDDYIHIIRRGLASKTLNLDLLFYERYGEKALTREIKKWMNVILPILYAHVGLLIILSYLAFILPMMDLLGTI